MSEKKYCGNASVSLEHDEAIKTLLERHLDAPIRRRRMKREYDICLFINEQEPDLNVCRVIPDSFVDEQDKVEFRMQRINHGSHTLDDLVGGFKGEKSTPFDIEKAKMYFIQLIEIIDLCHELGIVHRDIKPNNIIINEGTQTLFLIDFGLACKGREADLDLDLDDTITKDDWTGFRNALIQLPEFENATTLEDARDPRSDLAQCVALLCYMLTGKTRMELNSESQGFNPCILDYQLNYIVVKGLQYVIESRFQSAREILEILNISEGFRYWLSLTDLLSDKDLNPLNVIKDRIIDEAIREVFSIESRKPRLSYDGTFTVNIRNNGSLNCKISNIPNGYKVTFIHSADTEDKPISILFDSPDINPGWSDLLKKTLNLMKDELIK
eukprot:TRINITY_DN7752_c0_g1_i1.p1 TRINITY_DN7752_c0_g1~~TRINITY_DN7752_c0_g1_i1.p1  ORF type:complete len:384 (-),score=66.27 TRINITY_DN7752_c0_g1_i1:22-1173(-)